MSPNNNISMVIGAYIDNELKRLSLWLVHRSKLRNHYYAYPPLALMIQKGVTPNWRRPPFPLNIKYSVPHSSQNLI